VQGPGTPGLAAPSHPQQSLHLRQPGRVNVTVPVQGSKTLKTGTQRGIMKDAGLTDADL
jgi:predicted RNA binding protein YcfA (HicA-like mRNA interferase family)